MVATGNAKGMNEVPIEGEADFKGEGTEPAAHTAHDCGHDQTQGVRCGSIPVIVLTGYLGAGKTTLLNYILQEQRQLRLGVVENEIGEVSIDNALVEQKHQGLAEDLVVLNNGCVCCTIRGDLVNTLHNIAEKQRVGRVALDGVLIELTGSADPAPVVHSLMVDDLCKDAFKVDNVVALLDAKHGLAQLDECGGASEGTACAQIAFSSTVLLNKIDLVDATALDTLEKRVKEINSVVSIIRCEHGRVDMNKLINVGAFDLAKVLEEQYMDEEEFNSFYQPRMDSTISNVGIRSTCAISLPALHVFVGKYLDEEDTAKDFMRIKGLFNIAGSDKIFVMQCVHMLRNHNFEGYWSEGEPRENRIIFIGRNMEGRRQELTEGFMECIAKPVRFPIGTKVLANVNSFTPATILKQWDEGRPYRIRLEDGMELWAPLDDDIFVKAA